MCVLWVVSQRNIVLPSFPTFSSGEFYLYHSHLIKSSGYVLMPLENSAVFKKLDNPIASLSVKDFQATS